MKVLVCGGRDFDDWGLFIETMQDLSERYKFHYNQPITIIEGGAKGADFCARLYAKCCAWEHQPFPAKWNEYGKAAGGIRNQQMLDEGKPDLVVAFPGGSGTADMVRRAKQANVEVIVVQG